MLILYILLLISIILFSVPFYIEDTSYLILIGFLVLVFNLLVGLAAIRSNNNPDMKKYNELCDMYDYTTSHDSIPLKLKTDIYDECARFNTRLDDYDNYHNSIWVGVYYPELAGNRKLMHNFDISKIK